MRRLEESFPELHYLRLQNFKLVLLILFCFIHFPSSPLVPLKFALQNSAARCCLPLVLLAIKRIHRILFCFIHLAYVSEILAIERIHKIQLDSVHLTYIAAYDPKGHLTKPKPHLFKIYIHTSEQTSQRNRLPQAFLHSTVISVIYLPKLSIPRVALREGTKK